MKTLLVAIAVAGVAAFSAAAQTNTVLTLSPFQNVVAFIGSNGELLPAGVGVNLHGKVGESLAQQLDVLGGGGTNLWRIGVVAETFFDGQKNQEELGLGASYEVRKMPGVLKHFLILTTIPKEVKFGASVTEPVELYVHGVKGYDWKQTTINVTAGWSF